MHELSIANSVVSTVLHALPPEAGKVRTVRVRVGELSGVVPQALEFAYEVAVSGTRLEDAVLEIERSSIVVDCPRCGEQTLAGAVSFACPVCDVPCGNVVFGKEIEVLAVTFDEVEELVAGAR